MSDFSGHKREYDVPQVVSLYFSSSNYEVIGVVAVTFNSNGSLFIETSDGGHCFVMPEYLFYEVHPVT